MASPRLTQFSHGCDLLHLSLRNLASAPLLRKQRQLVLAVSIGASSVCGTGKPHFLFRHGAHDSGTLFLFLTTRYCPSGENCPLLVADGGVGVILGLIKSGEDGRSVCGSFCARVPEGGTQAKPKFIRPFAQLDVFETSATQVVRSLKFCKDEVVKCIV